MTAEDYHAVLDLYKDPMDLEYMDSFFPEEGQKDFFESYVNNMYRFYGFGMYVIEDASTGKIIGHAGLGVEDAEGSGEARVTLGYLVRRDLRARGIAFYACRAILTYARDQFCLEEVCIRVHEANEASWRTARKLQREFGAFVRVMILKKG